MNEHLTVEQIAELLAMSADDAVARRHLANCRECDDELNGMKGAIGGFAALMQEEAGWRQLRPITLAKAERSGTHGPKLVWAFAVMLVAVAMVLLRWTPSSNHQSLASQQSEDTLLLEIQEDLNREVPDALAPALVLTAERNRIIGQEQRRQNR